MEMNDGGTTFTQVVETSDINKITEEQALDIANKILTRTRANTNISVSYVLNENNPITRSAGVSDTLAYIFNYGVNNGFAVIASDNRVFPLLVFSETGHFAYEEDGNDPIYACFVSRIDDYLATADENDTIITIPDDFMSTCYWTAPLLETSGWSQGAPYDKYVKMEHPGCPTGCVAVATAQIMINCKKSFYYHDSLYRCHAITEGLKTHRTKIVGGDPDSVICSYETAVDHAARLLYWVGKDLYINYTPNGSSGSSYSARSFLSRLGYDVKESTLISFSDTAIANRIDENRLIYFDGRLMSNTSNGHAWIIDGYGFNCSAPEIMIFHCDWGWGGNHNGFYSSVGYYCGDVFAIPDYEYGNMKYFSVKIN